MWVQSLLENSTGSHSPTRWKEIPLPQSSSAVVSERLPDVLPVVPGPCVIGTHLLPFALLWARYSLKLTGAHTGWLRTGMGISFKTPLTPEPWHLQLEAHPYWTSTFSSFTSGEVLSGKIPSSVRRKGWAESVSPWVLWFSLYLPLIYSVIPKDTLSLTAVGPFCLPPPHLPGLTHFLLPQQKTGGFADKPLKGIGCCMPFQSAIPQQGCENDVWNCLWIVASHSKKNTRMQNKCRRGRFYPITTAEN